MTSKLTIPTPLKENSVMKDLVGKRITKTTKFMGTEVTITKLSVAEVKEIQEASKPAEEGHDDEATGIEVLRKVIQLSCPESRDLSQEDFETFPIDELSKLSEEIMKFSGMGNPKGK